MDNIFYLITREQSAISNQQSAISNQQSAIANLNFFNNIFSLIFYKAISALHNFFNFVYNIIIIIFYHQNNNLILSIKKFYIKTIYKEFLL